MTLPIGFGAERGALNQVIVAGREQTNDAVITFECFDDAVNDSPQNFIKISLDKAFWGEVCYKCDGCFRMGSHLERLGQTSSPLSRPERFP